MAKNTTAVITLLLACAGALQGQFTDETFGQTNNLPENALAKLLSISQSPVPNIYADAIEWMKVQFTLNPTQEANAKIIMEQAKAMGIKDKGQITYILATAYNDSGLIPRKEIRAPVGTKAREIQDEYWLTGYYGRGFTTLKLKEKYSEFGTRLKLALVSNPDLALESVNAAKILVYGMKNGTFNGSKISDFIMEDVRNFQAARKTVQNQENANEVALAATHILEGEEVLANASGLIYDSALIYSLIVRSTYANPDRQKLTPPGVGYLLGNTHYGKDKDNENYQLKLLTESSQVFFKNHLFRLHDTSKLYTRLNNDQTELLIDKYAYLDFLALAKWYGPFTRYSDGSGKYVSFVALNSSWEDSFSIVVSVSCDSQCVLYVEKLKINGSFQTKKNLAKVESLSVNLNA